MGPTIFISNTNLH